METFDPEKELASFKNPPTGGGAEEKKERRKINQERLDELKDTLAVQKEDLADLRAGLITAVQENPALSLEEMRNYADSYAERSGFSKAQKQEAYRVIEEYGKKNRAVLKLKTRFEGNDDACEVFTMLFKERPEGRIEIFYGPMTIFLRCHNLRDYAWIFSGLYAEPRRKTKNNLTDEIIAQAQHSGGLRAIDSNWGDLSGCVLVEKATPDDSPEHMQNIFAHEKEHAIEHLFPLEKEQAQLSKRELKSAPTAEAKKQLLEKFLLALRKDSDHRVKDEIFAYFTGGRTADDIKQLLTMKEREGGLYDYFSQARENLTPSLVNEFGIEHKALFEETVNELFDLTKNTGAYYNYICERISAFQKLLNAGYNVEQAKGLLEYEPVWKWEKAVKRQLEQKTEARGRAPLPPPEPQPKKPPSPESKPHRETVWGKIKNITKKAWNGVKRFAKKAWNGVKNFWKKMRGK